MVKKRRPIQDEQSAESPHSPPSDDEHKEPKTKKKHPKKSAAMPTSTNTESQQMLALTTVLKRPDKKDKEIQEFRAKLTEDQKGLRDLLQRRLERVEKADSLRRKEISTMIADALLSSTTKSAGVAPMTGTAITANPILASSLNIIQAGKTLLNDYKTMSEKVASAFPENVQATTEEWERDVDRTAKILEIGHKRALRDVKKVLGLDTAEAGNNGSEKAGEDADDDIGDEELPKREIDTGLHKTLSYAERGVKRLAKGLPEDIDIEDNIRR